MNDFKDSAESAIIELETISPIHIRGKEVDYGEGMVVLNRKDDQLGSNYAYLIDNDVLCDWLYNEAPKSNKMEYIDAYVNYFKRVGPDKQSLMRFLRDNKLIKKLEDIPKDTQWYKIFKGRTFQQKKNGFIQNGKGKCYIPGSSIKGCFKTAVLYSILKKEKSCNPEVFKKKYSDKICELIKRNKNGELEAKYFADELLEKVFSIEPPPEWEKHKPKKHNLDFFRCVHIADAHIESIVWTAELVLKNWMAVHSTTQERIKLHEDDIRKFELSEGDTFSKLIFEKKDRCKRIVTCVKSGNIEKNVCVMTLGRNGNIEKKSMPSIKVQCFEGKASFRVTIDMELLNKMFPDDDDKPFKNIDDLLAIMEKFAGDLWKEEQAFFMHDISNANSTFISNINNFYKETHCPTMRIGWGTGLLGMTILSLFDKNDANGKTSIRKQVRNLANDKRGQIAPKSRRVVLDRKNTPFRPLGWCKLKILSEIKMETGDDNGS